MLHYFIFYKPFQVLSQFSPEENKKTLSDYLSDIPKDVYPVGRLDYDSEGLLVLTNDKQLTHHLLDPKFSHPRNYLVQVEGIPDAAALNRLGKGVDIKAGDKRYRTKPSFASLLSDAPHVPDRNPPVRYRANIPTSWISLTLTEGKNRQVRKMTAAVGYPTLRLIRYSIGDVTIDGLEPGIVRKLNAEIRGKLLNKG